MTAELAGQTSLVDRPATGPGALCDWCDQPIPAGKRRDADTCSKRCRQSRWRFGKPARTRRASTPTRRAGQLTSWARPMRLCYADPPYPGMSARYYAEHPDFAGEVDHAALLAELAAFDGWALSTSSKTLAAVLALCPPDVRIGAWTKPAPPGYTQRPRCAWEPVIFHGGRALDRDRPMVLDWIHAAPPRSLPDQVVGTKPSAFSFWVFDSLGADPARDELVDLFPGSGAVAKAWVLYGAESAHAPPALRSAPAPL